MIVESNLRHFIFGLEDKQNIKIEKTCSGNDARRKCSWMEMFIKAVYENYGRDECWKGYVERKEENYQLGMFLLN